MKKYYFALVLTLFVLPFFAQNIPSYVPKDGLIGYWPFNGNANDESGNGKNGTVNGATLTTDRNGVANSAYSFDGIKNYIQTELVNGFKNQFTVQAWVKTLSSPEAGIVCSRSSKSQFNGLNYTPWHQAELYYGSKTESYGIGADPSGKNSINNGIWHHIVGVYYGNKGLIYIDGKLMDSLNYVIDIVISDPFIFGSDPLIGYNRYFKGQIDDIAIYNRALTEQEIAGLYTEKPIAQNIPSYVPTNGLVGYWPFNGNANDESGNGNNGTVNGPILTTDRNGKPNSAYEFFGPQVLISVENSSSLEIGKNDYSLSAWIKTKASKNGRIISKGSSGCETGYMMRTHDSSQNLYTENANNNNCYVTHASSKKINDGEWQFVSVVVKRNNVSEIYINGVLDSKVQNMDDIDLTNNQKMFFGFNNLNNSYEPFEGIIDDIVIYNRALTEQEITALYTSTPPCANTTVAITTSDSTTFCQGGSAILTAAVTTASTPIYQWYNNDQAITNATQNNYKATTAGKYTVKVVDGACEAVSLPKEVTVNPRPTATISPSGNVSKICEGSTLTLVADGGVSYKWNTGATENKITVSKKGPYYADVINQFGCKSVVWRDVVVEALPTVTINNLKQIAFKNEVSILLEGTPKGGVFTGEGVNGNTFNPEKAALGKKAITYTYSTTNGCKGEAKGTILLVDSLGNVCSSTKYDTVTVTNNVTKYDTVIVPKTVTKYDTVKVNTYDTITFTNTVTKYDTVIVNKTKYDTVIVPKTVTKYDTITVKNNIYDTVIVPKTVTKYDTVLVNKYDTITVNDTVNILKINFKLTTGIKANQMTSMSIYPNPTSDVLIIDASDLAAITGYSYRILDVIGKEVYNALVTSAKTEISLKTLGAKGMYVLHILDANKLSVQTKQIVLE